MFNFLIGVITQGKDCCLLSFFLLFLGFCALKYIYWTEHSLIRVDKNIFQGNLLQPCNPWLNFTDLPPILISEILCKRAVIHGGLRNCLQLRNTVYFKRFSFYRSLWALRTIQYKIGEQWENRTKYTFYSRGFQSLRGSKGVPASSRWFQLVRSYRVSWTSLGSPEGVPLEPCT